VCPFPEDYSVWIAIPLLILSNIATVLWNFQDALVVLMSMGLSSRYRRLNQYVAKVCFAERKDGKKNIVSFWILLLALVPIHLGSVQYAFFYSPLSFVISSLAFMQQHATITFLDILEYYKL
jgi:hypothetical protein